MDDWEKIRNWRQLTRIELLKRRLALSPNEKRKTGRRVCNFIVEHFPKLRLACIGFYWPFKGEIDLRHLVSDLMTFGAAVALPVVVEKRQPLEFWSWQEAKMERGICNIPIPQKRDLVRRTALLIPLVGFDRAAYRLGYGGGYYDRTLATLVPKPLTIGVGYELGRLETIYPQPHAIPLDAIVT